MEPSILVKRIQKQAHKHVDHHSLAAKAKRFTRDELQNYMRLAECEDECIARAIKTPSRLKNIDSKDQLLNYWKENSQAKLEG